MEGSVVVSLLFDEHFSKELIKLLNRALPDDVDCVSVKGRSGWQGLPDKELFPQATKSGFTLVTVDSSMLLNQVELHDVAKLGGRMITIFGKFGSYGLWEQVKWLVRSMDKIVANAAAQPVGTCLRVLSNRRCQQWTEAQIAAVRKMKAKQGR